jgi:enoyl-CoA hydratase
MRQKRGEVAYITLNRPEKLNAIDTEVDELLFEAWTRFRDDPEVRLAILSGNGEKAFCAGADLATHVDGWLGGGPDLGRNVLHNGFAGGITRGLHRTNKPIIAALHGMVMGGGIELALACDIRVAAADAQFGFYHMRRGMHFAGGGIVRLVNTCGVGIAMELELMGEAITAERAKECHLVNRVVPRGQLMPTVKDIAAKILRNPRTVATSDGAPVPGVELRIVADGKPAPAGAEGEIRYCGPGRLLEYWGRPDLTAESIDDGGWWRTGDLGRLDDSGYLRVSRMKDIIIRGGFNVSAREVEEALLALPGIASVAVIGLPDAVVGERVCAVIEPAAGHEPPALEHVRDRLANQRGMAVWKIPERIEIVTQWPVTATGKVKKHELRKAIANMTAPPGTTFVETALAGDLVGAR